MLVTLIICSVASAKDIQLFNPDIMSQPTSSTVKILQDKNAGGIDEEFGKSRLHLRGCDRPRDLAQ